MNAPDTRPATLWALATALVTVAPHTLYQPLWVSAVCGALLLWQGLRIRQGTAGARMFRILIPLLAIAAIAGIRLHYGYFFGKEPCMALLAVLLCLKLLEGSTTRDLRAAILLALFLQLGLFFNDQSMPVAVLALFGALCATATLLSIEDPTASPRQALRSGGVLMLQALPFLLVLFVLFPRIPGPLWGMPADAHSGVTGLSDEMQAGSISQLIQSSDIALRAEFDGEPPPPSQRYWRGPVLSEFDGRVWRARAPLMRAAPTYPLSGPRYDYTAIIEPHNRRWLLAMDYPGPTERPRTRYASDFQLLSDLALTQRTRITLSAWPQARAGLDESPVVLQQALQLPADSNPRTRRLVAELTKGIDDPAQALEKVLGFLQQNALSYTLSPPLLGTQPVDEFLFDTRSGFCEHFSSAFTFMMRAAGVPARVVTGYQGGTFNRFDGSMVVRQSDAHAWSEVWLPEQGWVRIDPTALAVPDRIERGLANALPVGETLPFMLRNSFAAEALRNMRDRWEALSHAWNRNIVGFDQLRQRGLLASLGLDATDLRTLSLWLIGTMLALMLGLLGWILRQRPSGDHLDWLWQSFCAKLARKGLARLPSEGPIDYADRVARALPASAAQTRLIATTYARLRYGRERPDAAALTHELTHRIRKFKPQ